MTSTGSMALRLVPGVAQLTFMPITSFRVSCAAPLLLVVLLASTSTVLGQAEAGTNSTAEYRTIYDAGMK